MTVSKVFLLLSCILSQALPSAIGNPVTKEIYADSVVFYAKTLLGVPYKWAGNTTDGFDCSGFVSYVYSHFGIILPRSSADYASLGNQVSMDNCQKGDIILFCGTDNDLSTIGHVGIVITNPGEPLCFIHSSSSKKNRGVIISEFKGTGYVNRYIGIRRLTEVKIP
jgi:peptidoglycan DL-endopeptidase CwlO